ncbi:MAG TPA: hypothetical protein VKE94_13295, partial [Gemmataceae bacterium]|nr:hypothetical protein [Gemmataceae bacterium]
VVLGLGGIGWLMWPVEPPRVLLAAYDAVAAPDELIKLYARLEPESRERTPKLDGLEVWFQVQATLRSETLATDSRGDAAIDWQAPKSDARPLEFMARHRQVEDPKKVASDHGRIFVWPAKAKLLVVDVDYALVESSESFADGGSTAPTLRSGAAAALQILASRFKIVYISAVVNEPSRYKRMRNWITQARLPEGPLLGPSVSVDAGDRDAFKISQIEALKKRFTEPAVGIAARDEEVQLFVGAGWKTVVIGDATRLPADVTRIVTWAELPKQLEW